MITNLINRLRGRKTEHDPETELRLAIGKLCQVAIDGDPAAKNILALTYRDTTTPRRLAVVIVADNADGAPVWAGVDVALRWVRHMEADDGER